MWWKLTATVEEIEVKGQFQEEDEEIRGRYMGDGFLIG